MAQTTRSSRTANPNTKPTRTPTLILALTLTLTLILTLTLTLTTDPDPDPNQVCPHSAVDSLMAASPSRDKQCCVYAGLRHEVLFERRAPRERATADVVAFVSSRLAAARGARPPSKL